MLINAHHMHNYIIINTTGCLGGVQAVLWRHPNGFCSILHFHQAVAKADPPDPGDEANVRPVLEVSTKQHCHNESSQQAGGREVRCPVTEYVYSD